MFPEIHYNDTFTEKWLRYLSPTEWRNRVTLQFIDVQLASLEHAGCSTDPDVVKGWERTIRDGCPVPPPVAVLTERGTFYVCDGNHRLEALSRVAAEENPLVRVGVIVPLDGWCFKRKRISDYSTYVLHPVRQPSILFARLLLPILLSVAAVLTTLRTPGVDTSPFFAFLVAGAVLSAAFGGVMAGLLSTGVNTLAAAYLMLAPIGSFAVAERHLGIQLMLSALAMASVSVVVGARSWREQPWAKILPRPLMPR
jgi:hypothetical protein